MQVAGVAHRASLHTFFTIAPQNGIERRKSALRTSPNERPGVGRFAESRRRWASTLRFDATANRTSDTRVTLYEDHHCQHHFFGSTRRRFDLRRMLFGGRRTTRAAWLRIRWNHRAPAADRHRNHAQPRELHHHGSGRVPEDGQHRRQQQRDDQRGHQRHPPGRRLRHFAERQRRWR